MVRSPERVFMNVHDEVVVVVPVLVAPGSITAFDSKVHGRLEDVAMDVVKHAGDGDILDFGVNVGSRPRMVGEGVAVFLDGGHEMPIMSMLM